MSDDDLFREVNEELRREQMKKLWDKYGLFVIGGALAIILFVGGSQFMNYYRASQAASAGAELTDAFDLVSANKEKKAAGQFQKLAKSGPEGYQQLSRLALAGMKANEGKIAEAVASYDDLAKDSRVDALFRDYARIQSAMLQLSTASEAKIRQKLAGLTGQTNPWRFSANELLGIAAYKAGHYKTAEAHFAKIAIDPKAPRSVKQRADMMLTLIAAKTATSAKATPVVTRPDNKPESKAAAKPDSKKPAAK